MALDSSLKGGIQGGFLVQNGNTVTGQFVYAFSLVSQPGTFCNSGTASISGTVNGQNVTLTAVAGVQTLTFSGTLSTDGKTLMGMYNSTDGQGCGTPQTGLTWSAVLVPPLNGAVQGNFHSTGNGIMTLLSGQDFPVTGTLFQGPNTGASSATITGTLNFQGYPCLASASVNGEITGNSAVLQVIAPNGLNAGGIGAPPNKTPNTLQMRHERQRSTTPHKHAAEPTLRYHMSKTHTEAAKNAKKRQHAKKNKEKERDYARPEDLN
jgi:hypothetical protein